MYKIKENQIRFTTKKLNFFLFLLLLSPFSETQLQKRWTKNIKFKNSRKARKQSRYMIHLDIYLTDAVNKISKEEPRWTNKELLPSWSVREWNSKQTTSLLLVLHLFTTLLLCPLFDLHTQNPIHQKDNTFGTQTVNQPRNLALACRLCQPQKNKIEFYHKKNGNLSDKWPIFARKLQGGHHFVHVRLKERK